MVVNEGSVSELLGLLLVAGSLSDLERIEVHHFAQGLAQAHCDNVINLDILEAGGKVTDMFL